jgi:hypothetical protein
MSGAQRCWERASCSCRCWVLSAFCSSSSSSPRSSPASAPTLRRLWRFTLCCAPSTCPASGPVAGYISVARYIPVASYIRQDFYPHTHTHTHNTHTQHTHTTHTHTHTTHNTHTHTHTIIIRTLLRKQGASSKRSPWCRHCGLLDSLLVGRSGIAWTRHTPISTHTYKRSRKGDTSHRHMHPAPCALRPEPQTLHCTTTGRNKS